jgi:hypothetical protein
MQREDVIEIVLEQMPGRRAGGLENDLRSLGHRLQRLAGNARHLGDAFVRITFAANSTIGAMALSLAPFGRSRSAFDHSGS